MMQSTGGVTVKVFEKSLARELLILTLRSSLISRNPRPRRGQLKAPPSLTQDNENSCNRPLLRGTAAIAAIRALVRERIGTRCRSKESRAAQYWSELHQAHRVG